MISLNVTYFQWANGLQDDPKDQCAHGQVDFRVNNTVFVAPSDGTWTISASALYLLRTINEEHSIENSVTEGNQLFPCCGFNVWDCGNKFKVICMGCPSGIDLEIIHQSEYVIFRSKRGVESIKLTRWRAAVINFVDSVFNFYQTSSPKEAIEDDIDRQGWSAFWLECNERYTMAKAELDKHFT